MGLVIPWSMALALVDAYAVFLKSLPRRPKVMMIVIVGDWVSYLLVSFPLFSYSILIFDERKEFRFLLFKLQALSFLSLSAACSTASVTELLMHVNQPNCPAKLCSRYQMSAATAFLAWFVLFASCLFNLWLFASL